MMTFIFTDNPEVVRSYNQEFQRILNNSRRLFQQSDSPEQILNIFGAIFQSKATTNFALESHPCLALMSYGPEFIQLCLLTEMLIFAALSIHSCLQL